MAKNCSILSQKVPKFELYKLIMMSFLTYITRFFMNFELLPILTNGQKLLYFKPDYAN